MNSPVDLFQKELKNIIDDLYKDDIWNELIYPQVLEMIDPDGDISKFIEFQIQSGQSKKEALQAVREMLKDKNQSFNSTGASVNGKAFKFTQTNE